MAGSQSIVCVLPWVSSPPLRGAIARLGMAVTFPASSRYLTLALSFPPQRINTERDVWHEHSAVVVTEGKTKEVWNATGLLSSSMTRVFKGRECFDLWAVEEAWPDRDCFKYLWPLLTNISTAIYSQGGSGKQS